MRIWFATLLAIIAVAGTSVVSAGAKHFYVNYSAQVDAPELLPYDLCILQPNAGFDLKPVQESGVRVLAYVSIGEVAADAPYRAEVLRLHIPFLGTNSTWNSDYVDLSASAWHEFVIGQLARNAADRGFDGFFLDTVEAVETLANKFPNRAAEIRAGTATLIRKLRQAYPEKQIVLNRGFSLFESVHGSVDGILAESLFQTYDFKTKRYEALESADTRWLQQNLSRWKEAGLDVYVIDYVDPAQPDLARETALKIEALDYNAFITTPELMGHVLAPLREVKRKVLSLHGNDPRTEVDPVRFPIDSFNHLRVQVVLEWFGFEMESHNAFLEKPPSDMEGVCAIITDPDLVLPDNRQSLYVNWLIEQAQRGIKLVFLGRIPIAEPAARRRLIQALGMDGSGEMLPYATEQVLFSSNEEALGFEAPLVLNRSLLFDVQAPSGAARYLSITNHHEQRSATTFDAIFTAGWGGMWHRPYMAFQRPNLDSLWLVDPFAFFADVLDVRSMPVPDSTTRDGLRLLYSHIDGDGFSNLSETAPSRLCAEVIRDQVLTGLPLPVTFSIIESEIRGHLTNQVPSSASVLPEIARSIFALPNIQAASHTYAHPYYWLSTDESQSDFRYESQFPPIKGGYQLDLRREVFGSVEYTEKELLPAGKRVELMLWSGNCRVPSEALRYARELGIENMNGGNTLITAERPSIMEISPRTAAWGREVQVYAANQNENPYTRDWTGPYFGAYLNVLDTFERTETPRRMKPVNIYYHLYCAEKHASLKAVKEIYRWALSQPLHAVTASQYAKIARDCRQTRLYSRDPSHWIIINEGHARTFRLESALTPDMTRSRGVSGFHRRGNSLYIHTRGNRRTEIVLASNPSNHAYLVTSSAEIHFERLDARFVVFDVADLRPVQVEFGGFTPSQWIEANVSGAVQRLQANSKGRIQLELPNRARVTLTASSS